MTYSTLNIGVTLKSRLSIVQGHWKWHHLIDRLYEFLFIFYCTILEIKRDAGRKTLIFIPASV